MFIDDKYFVAGRTTVAGINITSCGEKSRQALDAQNHINDWIADKEPIFLRAMLGDELYSRLRKEHNERRHNHHDSPDYNKEQLFDKVKEILVDSEYLRSPIAYYVYFFYERNRVSVTTVSGERVKKSNESTAASPMFKLVALWNDMVDWNYRIIEAFERAEIPVNPDLDDDIFHKINIFNI